MATTAAQDEYNDLISKNTGRETLHPDDRDHHELSQQDDDLDEEATYRNAKIDAAMRVPTGASELKLPPASFDSGRSTGVKGVIADARSFETARKSKWMDRAKSARQSILGLAGVSQNGGGKVGSKSESETDDDTISAAGSDEESFLQQWRESRRRELENEMNRAVRTRRTSPSVRVYGRLDEVDALGYLDAIEKVSRETKVVVFVYDHEVCVPFFHTSLFFFIVYDLLCQADALVSCTNNLGVVRRFCYYRVGPLAPCQVPHDNTFCQSALRGNRI